MKNELRHALDERGVSPVIGVILMVAITVILAAVIGSFVLGIGGDVQAAPQASLSFTDSANAGNVNVSHQGGDALTAQNINYTVDGGSPSAIPSDLSPGQSIELTSVGSGEHTIRFIHVPTGNVIAESTVQVS